MNQTNTSTSTKTFKKGDLVTLIGDWNGKGTIYMRDCTVVSCGKRQMVLAEDHTGITLKEFFSPVANEMQQIGGYRSHRVINRASIIETTEAAHELFAAQKAAVIARAQRMIARGEGGERYLQLQHDHVAQQGAAEFSLIIR